MLRFARGFLLILNIGNWLAIAGFALMVAILLLSLPIGMDRVIHAALPGQADAMRRLMLAMFAIGIAMGVAVDQLFRRLIHMLDTVVAGRPFTVENGARLRVMVWSLLAIQLLDTGFAFVVRGINHTARHAAFTWSPSVTGWITVLLLLVLAQVFTRGATMQDELEGTI